MDTGKLKELQMDPAVKRRPTGSLWVIFVGVIVVSGVAAFYAWPRESDSQRKVESKPAYRAEAGATNAAAQPTASSTNSPAADNTVLTVSGYIINRERIELSPRFMGTVSWIGVKKGDTVTNGQVVVRLDDAEFRARLHEVEGRLATAKANVARVKLDYDRIVQLNRSQIESKKTEDDARIQVEISQGVVQEIEGAVELARAYLDWTVIKSPINGVVLEKLVEPNELVVPQSFGGTRGPSTALIAVADPKDLQVEIDVNEADLSKITMNQKCKISPEAYPEKSYAGHVAEIAPEADRQKGTLQIKVQIHEPDRFLTPNLNAKVDFLRQ